MRGKLVKQDENDEPASVLLEKIATEKAQLIKEKKIKKGKKLPEITEDEIPFEIPDSWKWVRFKQILKPEVTKKPEKDFRYIDIASINNNKNIVENPVVLNVSKDKIPSRAREQVESEDILFSIVRPYLKNIAMVPNSDMHTVASTGFYVIKPLPLINRKYIFYLCLSNYIVSNMTNMMRGDNSPSIRKGDLSSYLIPIPPIVEQKRIVNKLEKLFNVLS